VGKRVRGALEVASSNGLPNEARERVKKRAAEADRDEHRREERDDGGCGLESLGAAVHSETAAYMHQLEHDDKEDREQASTIVATSGMSSTPTTIAKPAGDRPWSVLASIVTYARCGGIQNASASATRSHRPPEGGVSH